jgi:hypothetical protein
MVYAVVEASDDKGGIYRSANRGASWEKRSAYLQFSGNYYQELTCDPQNPKIGFTSPIRIIK